MNDNNIEWTKLAEVNSFQDNPQQLLKIKRDDILVIKDEEKFYAINNRCPHLGLALNLGGCDMKNKNCMINNIDLVDILVR